MECDDTFQTFALQQILECEEKVRNHNDMEFLEVLFEDLTGNFVVEECDLVAYALEHKAIGWYQVDEDFRFGGRRI